MTREQHVSLSPASQVTQVVALVAPVAPEYVPAQHRHASVDRHEAVRVALLHQLPSAATRHAPMLHLSSAPHFAPHTLLGQSAGTHTHTHQEKYEESTSKFRALIEPSQSLDMKCCSALTLHTGAPGALVEP